MKKDIENIEKFTPKRPGRPKGVKNGEGKELTPDQSQRAITRYQIEKYVLDAITPENYGLPRMNEAQKLQFIIDTLKSEKSDEVAKYDLKYAFISWTQGLPSVFNIDFEDYKIIEIGKEWGLIPTDASEAKEQAFIKNWWTRIHSIFGTLCNKHNVLFK